MTNAVSSDGGKRAWRVAEWANLVSLSIPYTNVLIRKKTIDSVKAGTRRLITTSPEKYLATLAAQKTSFTRRGRPVKQPVKDSDESTPDPR